MIYLYAALLVALIVAIAKALPLVFGGAARCQLAGAVPVAVSGLPPALAVAPQRARKGRKHRKGRSDSGSVALRGLTNEELAEFSDYEYSYLPGNINHHD